MQAPSIVWFRQDLRVEDQPALNAAIEKGGPIIPLFIWAPDEEKEWEPGAASRWWLHGALSRLQKKLKELGLDLIFRQQPTVQAILEITKETGADALFANQRYEPDAVKQEHLIKAELKKNHIQVHFFNGSLLFDPWEILNKQQKPYQVFTHFWKFCTAFCECQPSILTPKSVFTYTGSIRSDLLEQLNLLPVIRWDQGLYNRWQPNTLNSCDFLQKAIDSTIIHYNQTRDLLAEEGTSSLSPYLHYGEISPRMIWNEVKKKLGTQGDAEIFLRQIGWREFAYYLLYHFPHMPSQPLKSSFNTFNWGNNSSLLHAWQKGMTGYPVVDAAMRQLWQTGWMHNRARMIAGSFLVKDLLIDWRKGARWFWDTLVDADLANNSMGWQWISGCGVDAAPYFRIFNPVTQGEKFDPNGEYIRRWVPELSALSNRWIHKPWETPVPLLKEAGVQLGINYPAPIVDHAVARKKALNIYKIRSL